MIDRKQYTIMWRVDDLKMYQVNNSVNTNIITCLSMNLGRNPPSRPQGKRYTTTWEGYWNYSEKGKVKIKMLDYFEKMLADLPYEMDGEYPSPVANHMFTVDDNQTKMDENKAHFFHTYVAKNVPV
jgi:hypothetical protein